MLELSSRLTSHFIAMLAHFIKQADEDIEALAVVLE